MVFPSSPFGTIGGEIPIKLAAEVVVILGATAGLFVLRKLIVRPIVIIWNSVEALILTQAALGSVRLIAFNRDRTDYSRRVRSGQPRGSITEYISSAEHQLIVVSVSFITATQYENVRQTITSLAEKGVKITISLVNPNHPELLRSMATTIGCDTDELEAQIRNTITLLHDLKRTLSKTAKDRLTLRCHRTIPFASAIIIDPETRNGTIQLETKPYRVGIYQSFGFTLAAGGSHPLYTTLLHSYMKLIEDGVSMPDPRRNTVGRRNNLRKVATRGASIS